MSGGLTGEYRVTLDEKGRISLPAQLRRCLDEPVMFLTKGLEKCLQLYPSASWNEKVETIMKNTDSFSSEGRILRRIFIGPSQEVEIDKAGRIPLAITLREYAGIFIKQDGNKNSQNCVVLGQIEYIEIWSEESYLELSKNENAEYKDASEALSNILKGRRGVGV